MEGNTGAVDTSAATTDYSMQNQSQADDALETDVVQVDEHSEEDEESPRVKAKSKEESEDEADGTDKKQAKKPEQKKPAPQKSDEDLVLTIDGKKFKARDVNHLKQLAQKGVGSEKRFQEAAQAKRQAVELVQAFKSDPRKVMEQLGHDPYKFAYDLMNERIQYEEMDETQRKIYEYEQKQKQYEQERQTWHQTREREQRQRQEAQVAQELDGKLLESFKKSGLPNHKFYVQQIAASLLGAAKRGEDLSVEEATARVKERTFSDIQSLASKMDAKAIRKLIGDEAVKKLMDAEVKRVTDKSAPTVKSAGRPGPSSVPVQKPNKTMSPREWDAWVEKQRSRG